MRILHVYHTFAPQAGGIVAFVGQLTRELARIGHDVEIFTTNMDFPGGVRDVRLDGPVVEAGVTIRYFPVQVLAFHVSHQLNAALQEHMKRFDIVHVHGLYQYPQLRAGAVARAKGVPYIVQTHGTLDPVVYGKSRKSVALKRAYDKLFGLPLVRKSDGVNYTCQSEVERGAELKLNPHGFIVYSGVDWTLYETLPPKGAFRAAHNLGDAPLILFAGRINFKKGIDLLIKAMVDVVNAIPNAKLALAGPDNDAFTETVRGWIKDAGLENSVQFVGMLPRAQVIEACVDANVFVLPSYGENFGMSIVEAMACGCPIVVTNTVGIHHEVENGKAGIVVPCEPDPIGAALLKILQDKKLAEELGQGGRRVVQDVFAISQIARTQIAEYEGVIARKRAKS